MSNERIAWLDLETTGLNPVLDRILEIAVVITDWDLTIKHSVSLVIHQPEDVLSGMNSWCIEQHGKSGLSQLCAKSKVTLDQAEKRVIEFLKPIGEPGTMLLAGNSVHFDRGFLAVHMPDLEQYPHHRHIDVTSIYEMVKHWGPHILDGLSPESEVKHRALDDIHLAIKYLKLYRKALFASATAGSQGMEGTPIRFEDVTPDQVLKYIKMRGWEQTDGEKGKWSAWVLGTNSIGEAEILVPIDIAFRDYARRVSDLIENLSIVEKRPKMLILLDILERNYAGSVWMDEQR